MSMYKLDITLIKVDIEPRYVIPGNKVWFNFNCDGCTQSATTPCVPMQAEANFGTPCQFIINTADTMGSYFYLTLCYYGPNNQMIPLARARSRIGKLPLEAKNQKSFALPLMSVENREQPKQIASALFQGTLSNFSGMPPPYMPSMGAQAMPQAPMPSYQYQNTGNPTPLPQGSFGGMGPYQQQGSIPGYQQPGMMAPTPYAGAVPFSAHASQGLPPQAEYNVPAPAQQPQYQFIQQPGSNPQPGSGYQQPGSGYQQPGSGYQQPAANPQPNQQQNQPGSATIGDNQYYF